MTQTGTYDSLGAFVGDDPLRKLQHEEELGDFWLGYGYPPPAWRAAWLPATQELYLQRLGGVRPGGRVTVIGHLEAAEMHTAFAGWEHETGGEGSVAWLLERLGVTGVELPATVGAGDA